MKYRYTLRDENDDDFERTFDTCHAAITFAMEAVNSIAIDMIADDVDDAWDEWHDIDGELRVTVRKISNDVMRVRLHDHDVFVDVTRVDVDALLYATTYD